MNTDVILDYLMELERNNNREFYHAHKKEYQAAKAEFEALIQELIFRIGKTDGSVLGCVPGELTFRLTRDTRFSHDKSPYNPAFRAHISGSGKLPVPVGYYLMIKPGGQSFLGGGLFADMFKEATAMVRDYIAAHPQEWETVVQAEEFRACFKVQGTALKQVPAGYDREHPQAEFLKYKSWYLEYPVADEVIRDADGFLELAETVFRKMKPFNDLMNRALDGFRMPER